MAFMVKQELPEEIIQALNHLPGFTIPNSSAVNPCIVKQEKMTPEEYDLLQDQPSELDGSNFEWMVPSFINSSVQNEPSEVEESIHNNKKRKLDGSNSEPFIVNPPPEGLAPHLNVLPPSQTPMIATPCQSPPPPPPDKTSCKQFWKAGDYEVPRTSSVSSAGLDHARVHPRFLHSNATSHKWVLGAFAELLDNSVDEISHGATYVNVDILQNKKDGSNMLLFQDNGVGMNMDVMRHCMSLGYSAKTKLAHTIGQYGNGFKTSTMRLGADVIVFSRCPPPKDDGEISTQSIGMLSYTFLRSTGKDDIVVPILDYQRQGLSWDPVMRTSPQDWTTNLESILQWSPYSTEEDLLQQFDLMEEQGTRVIVYNLWEDDRGRLELDFDSDLHDIQIRGVNKNQAMIHMGKQYPSSWYHQTYQHSLRSYASILYLRLPPEFRITLRGKPVKHHNIVDDMMFIEKFKYKPQSTDNKAINVTIGFVKDAKHHIDVHGFNVYHKNRLIKPFWRIYNAASSVGRGVIGILEANFVEPAHDKQGFENTPVLERLRLRLLGLQKDYWKKRSYKIGYVPGSKRSRETEETKNSPPKPSSAQPDQFVTTSSAQPKGSSSSTTTFEQNKTVPLMDVWKKQLNIIEKSQEDHSKNLQIAVRASISDTKKDRVRKVWQALVHNLQSEKERCQNLEAKLLEKDVKIEALQKETESLTNLLAEERKHRGNVEGYLKDLKRAHTIIQARKKTTTMENKNQVFCKQEPH